MRVRHWVRLKWELLKLDAYFWWAFQNPYRRWNHRRQRRKLGLTP